MSSLLSPAVVNFAPEKGSVEIREIAVPIIGDDDVLLDGCTPFWNLYSVARYGDKKNNLTNAEFKYFAPDDANSAQNWLRDERGSSKFSYYWKVFYL